jgi:hypothetical protein
MSETGAIAFAMNNTFTTLLEQKALESSNLRKKTVVATATPKEVQIKRLTVIRPKSVKCVKKKPEPVVCPVPVATAPVIIEEKFVYNKGIWNESCFGTNKDAERLNCAGEKIPILCGCQQRVSQQWCSNGGCGGMYQFPMNTPGSASVNFVTFY